MHHHGLLNEGLIAAHAVQLTDNDIQLLRKQKTKVAHCPRSNSRLRNGAARYTDLLDAGVAVGFGTDSAASVDDLDVLAEARFAANLHRTRAPLHPFPAQDFIDKLTLGAARILGIDDRVGSLEAGKEADLAVFDIDSRVTYGLDRPYDLLLYGSCKLRDLYVAGREVVRSGAIAQEQA
jgi:5-methylthioadenosine/S-adenosylhomocysteine deaminase